MSVEADWISRMVESEIHRHFSTCSESESVPAEEGSWVSPRVSHWVEPALLRGFFAVFVSLFPDL